MHTRIRRNTGATPSAIWRKHNGGSGLKKPEFDEYFAGAPIGYAICIGRFWKLAETVPLKILRKRRAGFRPPQSYHYWNLDELHLVSGEVFSTRLEKRRGLAGAQRN
jgi:predicted transcriptional regulator